ncbi:MAG TPA: hypothetical protein DD473_02215 [Planctomycetaceae bacterium]|nr:hypothetical protein [Planctomycetaceae bacterium]
MAGKFTTAKNQLDNQPAKRWNLMCRILWMRFARKHHWQPTLPQVESAPISVIWEIVLFNWVSRFQ